MTSVVPNEGTLTEENGQKSWCPSGDFSLSPLAPICFGGGGVYGCACEGPGEGARNAGLIVCEGIVSCFFFTVALGSGIACSASTHFVSRHRQGHWLVCVL